MNAHHYAPPLLQPGPHMVRYASNAASPIYNFWLDVPKVSGRVVL